MRDEFLGIPSKDIDYSVVIPLEDWEDKDLEKDIFPAFVKQIESEGFDVFLETPDCFTARAKFPKDHKHSGVADFVIARKDLGFVDGSRKPLCVLGTLKDDLERRDFTVNAMAKDSNGNIIDPFRGEGDLKDGILKTPAHPDTSFNDDPLRILRAYRFAVTKNFRLSGAVTEAIRRFEVDRFSCVSTERIQAELEKMFMFDTPNSLWWFNELRGLNWFLYKDIWSRDLRLLPTMKKK